MAAKTEITSLSPHVYVPGDEALGDRGVTAECDGVERCEQALGLTVDVCRELSQQHVDRLHRPVYARLPRHNNHPINHP